MVRNHLLIPSRFLFILIALMFQAIFVLVNGTTLLKCLKKPLGISSYRSLRFDWIYPSECYITFIMFLAFYAISSVKLNSFLIVFFWLNCTFPDSKKWALIDMLPSISPFLTTHFETHSPVTNLDSWIFLLVIATWTSRDYSERFIKTSSK